VIVGVHGIGQQQFGRAQLLRDWAPAVSDGVEVATGKAPAGLAFDIAFYGDLFLRKMAGDGKGATGPSAEGLLAELDAAELSDLDEAVAEIVSAEEVEAAAELPPLMGIAHVPSLFQARLRAVDAKFGAAAGVLYVGELRQVRRYLCDLELKARVDGIVAGKIAGEAADGARILVGHSLGSVVAWEFVRQHPEHELDLLVTLGSPLGLRMVRSRLPEQGRTGRVPQHVGRWVNVRDPGDPVACAGDLATWWPEVDDRYVDNGWDDAHNACRYLSKAETGSAIAGTYPGLHTR
jgi:hypothetical protein